MGDTPAPIVATPPGPVPVIATRSLSLSFGSVHAVTAVSLSIYAGEVHALLGENGAGKSSLISILAGLVLPDAGECVIAGRPRILGSPQASRAAGIGVVAQHSSLVPGLTVWQNLVLGDPGIRRHAAAARERVGAIARRLGIALDPEALAGSLSLGAQQQVELIRALWHDPRVLILDEPTALSAPGAVAALLAMLRELAAEGIAVVLVTHRLEEVRAVADRVTVMRRGAVVDRVDPETWSALSAEGSRERILSALFGGAAPAPRSVIPRGELGRVVLELAAVTSESVAGDVPVRDLSLRLRAGEVLGISSIAGEGQRSLAEVIAGQRGLAGTAGGGQILLDGASIAAVSVARRRALGVRYLSADRLHEGTVGSLSVLRNLLLTRIGQAPLWRRGWFNGRRARAEVAAIIAEHDIRTPSMDAAVGTLSGGNIQRLVLARELAEAPLLAVCAMPTAGLDVATVGRVRDRLRQIAAEGSAVLVLSTDLEELTELADRVIVVAQGRAVGEVAAISAPAEGADPVIDRERFAARVGELLLASAALLGEPVPVSPPEPAPRSPKTSHPGGTE